MHPRPKNAKPFLRHLENILKNYLFTEICYYYLIKQSLINFFFNKEYMRKKNSI